MLQIYVLRRAALLCSFYPRTARERG